MKKSVIIKQIHKQLLNKADPFGRIERDKLFRIIAERIGKIEPNDKQVIILELRSEGVILEADKFSFTINKGY
jgi:hypothetical protein